MLPLQRMTATLTCTGKESQIPTTKRLWKNMRKTRTAGSRNSIPDLKRLDPPPLCLSIRLWALWRKIGLQGERKCFLVFHHIGKMVLQKPNEKRPMTIFAAQGCHSSRFSRFSSIVCNYAMQVKWFSWPLLKREKNLLKDCLHMFRALIRLTFSLKNCPPMLWHLNTM